MAASRTGIAVVALTGALAALLPSRPGLAQPQPQTALVPPAGNVAYLSAAAAGTQDYVCLPHADHPGQGVWIFLAPQAALSTVRADRRRGPDIAEHFLGSVPGAPARQAPAWRSPTDQSTVWGAKVASIAAGSGPECPNAGAVACLLLRAAANSPGEAADGQFAHTTFIQRTDTRGGSPPATACMPGQVALVPYTATYSFYRSR